MLKLDVPEIGTILVQKPNILLYSNDSNTREEFESLAKKNKKYNFFETKEFTGIAKRVIDLLGLEEKLEQCVIFDGGLKFKYLLEHAKKENLESFIQDYENKKLKQIVKTEKRTENDKHPDHPDLYKITASNFDEIVLDKNLDFFIDLYADWCGPCVAVGPYVTHLSVLFKDVSHIKIGKIDTDKNDYDRTKLFPEGSIPNMKLFLSNKKDNPIKYNGERNCEAMAGFLLKNSTKHVDNSVKEEILKKAKKFDKEKNERDQITEDLSTHFETLQILKDFNVSFNKEYEENINKVAKLLGDSESSIEEIEKIQNEIFDLYDKEIKTVSKKARADKEKKDLKNVIKIHESDEFKNYKKNEKRLIVVDFTASWCGPCQFIAPYFAQFSEKYTDVLFLKVDIDLLPDISSHVSSVPHFEFYKNSSTVYTFTGANPQELEKKINEYK